MWLVAVFYGLISILNVLKNCCTKGFRQVLSWKKRERPSCLDAPELGTHGFLKISEDIHIHYVASGPEDKPLMLFVHGFPEFWYSWRHQIREFQKDYRVVAIDQRGYSESSKPLGKENYTVTKLMADLALVIQGLGYKKCVLVAHDWGAIIAWAFGRKYSDMVDKLIIMNCPPAPLFKSVIKTSRAQFKKSWYTFYFQLPWLPEFSLKTNDLRAFDNMVPKKGSPERSEADLSAYKYTFSQPGALTGPINYYRAFFRIKPSIEHDLDYTMPMLLIWGEKDSALDIILPDTIEKTAPKIEVVRIPDANHFVQNDAPEKVNGIMRQWLDKIK